MPRKPRGGSVGRPTLSPDGAVRKTITVTPEHAAWLEVQPDGASAAVRRLIDQAMKKTSEEIPQTP